MPSSANCWDDSGPLPQRCPQSPSPSGPSFSSCLAVLGAVRDLAPDTAPPDTPPPDEFAVSEVFPLPDELGPVGRSPPAPGMLSWVLINPGVPRRHNLRSRGSGQSQGSEYESDENPAHASLYGSRRARLTGASGSMLTVRINRCHDSAR